MTVLLNKAVLIGVQELLHSCNVRQGNIIIAILLYKAVFTGVQELPN